MYKIIDLQGVGTKENRLFETKEDIIEELVDYHDIDFAGTDDKDNELNITEYFKFWKINTIEKQLEWLCEYGEWRIEEAKSDCCNAKFINNGFDVVSIYERNYHLECKKCNKMYEFVI